MAYPSSPFAVVVRVVTLAALLGTSLAARSAEAVRPPFDAVAFQRELRAAPLVEVTGVISARGVAGVMSKGETQYTIMFGLEPWRVVGGELETSHLNVRHLGPQERIHALRAELPPYSVLRIRARVLTKSAFPNPQAWLEEIVGFETADAELARAAEAAGLPVTFDDPLLGRLTLLKQIDVFEGTARWGGMPAAVHVEGGTEREAAPALATARALWRDESGWRRRIRDYVVAQMLPLKNEAWLSDDETELDAVTFANRLRLETIAVYPDGRFEFWFLDDDMFGGHAIQVRGDLEAGPTSANLAG